MNDSLSTVALREHTTDTPKDTAPGSPSVRTGRGRWRPGRVLRVVRRIHMYLGLFLVPWLFIFGISGVLFNHPNLGEKVQGRPVPPPVLESKTGFTAWDARGLAQQIVDTLNTQNAGRYRLDDAVLPEFHGPALLSAEYDQGRHTTLVDVGRGRAFIITREARPGSVEVPFKQHLEIEGRTVRDVEKQVSGLLTSLGLEARAPLEANPRIAPELRFAMRDASGEAYHVTYDAGSAELSGRPANSWSPVGMTQLLTLLHTTHHYTPKVGFRWAWAFFQDILGLAMAFWAISGMAMWWQLKATRIAGIVSIAAALGLAAWITWGTASELMFGEVMQELGPE